MQQRTDRYKLKCSNSERFEWLSRSHYNPRYTCSRKARLCPRSWKDRTPLYHKNKQKNVSCAIDNP